MKHFCTRSAVKNDALAGVENLYSYLYFMAASSALMASALPGAVMCMAVQSFRCLMRVARVMQEKKEMIGQGAAAAALLLILVLSGSGLENSGLLWGLSGAVIIRDAAGTLLGKRPGRWYGAVCAAVFIAVGAMLLTWVPGSVAWLLLAGFAVDNLMASQMRFVPAPDSTDSIREAAKALRQTNAGRTFLRLLLAVVTAGELMKAMLFRILLLPPLWGVLALAAAVCSFGAATAVRRAAEDKRGRMYDPTNMLLMGLSLWMGGLLVMRGQTPVHLTIGMMVVGGGGALCAASMKRMANVMRNVARYVIGETAEGYDGLAQLTGNAAMLVGSVTALLALWAVLTFGAQAIVLIGALVLVVVSLLCTLDYPLSSRWIRKLDIYLSRRAQGIEQPERMKQLDGWIREKHRQPFLVHVLVSVLRRGYPHHVLDVDRVVEDEDNPIVYLCNHGDLYGPVAAWLNIPTEKRPWSISYICTDLQTAEDYLFKYDWEPKTWMPMRLRHFMAHNVARFAIWGTGLLEAVPVWRDNPRQLMQTFRMTVEAMNCGDNLLIFPENPNAVAQDHGYETNGVGELFSGFTMLAQIYYNRTGKRCRFLPMFAHQPSRTVAFGHEIVYDPDANPIDERDRITREASEQMNDLANQLEENYRRGKKK